MLDLKYSIESNYLNMKFVKTYKLKFNFFLHKAY